MSRNCSCHLSPPCGSCTSVGECVKCGSLIHADADAERDEKDACEDGDHCTECCDAEADDTALPIADGARS